MVRACLLGLVATCVVPSPSFGQAPAAPIDRRALVTRHNPTLTRIDPTSPLMVGNGNLGFTADITGLQTFQEQYSPRVPLHDPGPMGLAQLSQPVRVLDRAGRPARRRARAVARPTRTCATGTKRSGRTSSGCARTRTASRSAGSACSSRAPTAHAPRSPICPTPGRRWTCGPAGSAAASCSTAQTVEVETSVHPHDRRGDRAAAVAAPRVGPAGRSSSRSRASADSSTRTPPTGRTPTRTGRGCSAATRGAALRSSGGSTTRAMASARPPIAALDVRKRDRTPSASPLAGATHRSLSSPSRRCRCCCRSAPARGHPRDGRRRVVGRVLERRRRRGLLRQHRSACARAGAARGALAVPHGGERRRPVPAAGGRPVLQQLERQVPHRDASCGTPGTSRTGAGRSCSSATCSGICASCRRPRRAPASTASAARGGRRWSGPRGARARARSTRSSCGSSRIRSIWPSCCIAPRRRARRSIATARSCSRAPRCSRPGRSTSATAIASCSARR